MSISLIFMVSVAASGAKSPRDSDFMKVARERTAVRSWEVVIRTKMLVQEPIPQFQDADWEFHYWYNEDGSFRLDRRKIEPKGTEDRDHTDNFSFDGAVYRVINRKDIVTYNLEYRKNKPWFKIERIDPRLLGLIFQPMEIFHHVDPLNIDRIVDNVKDYEQTDNGDGRTERFEHEKYLEYKYIYNNRNELIKFASISVDTISPRMTTEAQVEYKSTRPGTERLPTLIDYKVHKGESLIIHEAIEIQWLRINERFDKSLCVWDKLGVPKGSPIAVDDVYGNNNPVWDGTAFTSPATFRTRDARPNEPESVSTSASDVIFWISVNLGAICLALGLYRFIRRIRNERASKK